MIQVMVCVSVCVDGDGLWNSATASYFVIVYN